MFNNHMLNNHLMKACLAAVFAIGLAACSSSSDNGDTAMMPEPEPMPEPMEPEPEPTVHTVDLPENHNLSIESGESQTFTVAAGSDRQIGNTVFSCPAGGDACVVTVTSLLGEVQAEVTGGMATAALFMPPTEFTQAQAGDLADLFVDRMAMSQLKGIGDETNELNVEYGDAVSIKVPTQETDFTASDVAAVAIDGWQADALDRTNSDDSVDRVVAYSNAMDAEATTFAKKYGIHADARDNVSPNEPNVPMDAAFWKLAEANIIPANAPEGVILPLAEVTIDAGADAASIGGTFRGTFDGVSGEFGCLGTDACVLTRAASAGAEVTHTDGTFVFTADDADASVDGDGAGFTAFGWWLNTPTEGGEIETFAPFAFASTDAVDVDVAGIAGGAVYSGPAAGRYIMRQGGKEGLTTGVFTADAELEAQFGTAARVEGTITNFRDDDGESLGLSLDLREADMPDDSSHMFSGDVDLSIRGSRVTDYVADNADTANIDESAGNNGGWTASFHVQGAANQQPQTVIGTFGADVGVPTGNDDSGFAAVSGAFSASQ